jgi:hypothetical protein
MTRDKIDQLAKLANIDLEHHVSLSREPVWIATPDELAAFAALVLEEAAKGCDDLIDKREEARAALRAAKAIESGNEGDMLAALKHESNVNLYGVGISNCIKAIRAMKPEVK